VHTHGLLRATAIAALLGVAVTGAACSPRGADPLPRPLVTSSEEILARLTAPPPSVYRTDGLRLLAPRPIDVSALLSSPVTRGPRSGDMVAITVDDGPSRESHIVLDILQRERTRVTFFYCGRRIVSAPAESLRAIALGCEIGDHTMSHIELVGLPAERVRAEVGETRSIIATLTGETAGWVRPRGAREVVRSMGMAIALWDAYAGDTAPSPRADTIASRVLAMARPGSIILLHETNPETVKALPRIIAGLRAKGLRPVTLSEMFGRTPARGTHPVSPVIHPHHS
jgi:peptidoglycan/xylan/chitin deacetylase (PgdA/CDA1 family)